VSVFALPASGFALPPLPLTEANSLGVYAALCSTLSADLDPAATAFPLPAIADADAAKVVCTWMERAWQKRQPELQQHFQEQRAQIARVLQQVHPGMEIDDGALKLVQSLLDALLHRLLESRPTAVADVEAAVQNCLPGELAKYAVKEATKVVTTFAPTAPPGCSSRSRRPSATVRRWRRTPRST